MRANDPISRPFRDIQELLKTVRFSARVDTHGVREVGGEEKKDPIVQLARAVLLRAVLDSELPLTENNRDLIVDAREFLYGENNMHREFWRTLGKV